MKSNILFGLILMLVACAGGAAPSDKNLSLTVENSRSFNESVSYGQIDYYQISISADDLADPFVERFAGDSDAAQMLGIPVGDSRTILVEAYNMNGQVIRRGLKEGVSIYGDRVSAVNVVMNSVPIFTNLTDRSVVSGSRLVFGVFGEPGSNLEISEITTDESRAIVDETTGEARVNTSEESGVFSLTPDPYDQGVYTFKVRDTNSDESTTVTVSLYESTTRPGLAVNSGGVCIGSSDWMGMNSVGQPYYRAPQTVSDDLLDGTAMDVVQMVSQ